MATNDYTESEIIECNRQASEEALSGNNENNAMFNCNLSDIYHLEPGDTISMESAMINARGCGTQGRPIDVKGVTLNKTNTINYIKRTNVISAPKESITGFLYERNTLEDETYTLESNKANVVIGYYKSANAHNMMWAPRKSFSHTGKFANEEEFAPDLAQDHRNNNDDFKTDGTNGHCYFQRDFGSSESFRATPLIIGNKQIGRYKQARCNMMDDFRAVVKPVASTIENTQLEFKPKMDNTRFTIFSRRLTTNPVPKNGYKGGEQGKGMPANFDLSPANNYFHENQDSFDGTPNEVEPYDENKTPAYFRLKEKVELEMPRGFNSGEFIADELTRQLQQIKDTNTFEYEQFQQGITNNSFPTPVSRTIATNTYKPFSVASCSYMDYRVWQGFQRAYNVDFAGASDPFRFGTRVNDGEDNYSTWIANYNYIGVKRPELYETGFHINIVGDEEQGVLGGQIAGFFNNWDGLTGTPVDFMVVQSIDSPMILRMKYNKTNLDKWKAFIDAQAKYPEVWDNMPRDFTGYTDENSVDNSRWCHFNRYQNNFMATANGYSPASGYTTTDDILGTNELNFLPFTPAKKLEALAPLGSDGYGLARTDLAGAGGPKDFRTGTDAGVNSCRASLLFVYQYKSEHKDTFFDTPIFDESDPDPNKQIHQLTYGCFGKYIDTTNQYGQGVNAELCVLYPTPYVDNAPVPAGDPAFDARFNKFLTNTEGRKARYPARYLSYFDDSTGVPEIDSRNQPLVMGTKIGFDLHFTAPTSVVCVPMNGIPESPYPRSSSFSLKNFTTAEAEVQKTGFMPPVPPYGSSGASTMRSAWAPTLGKDNADPADMVSVSWTASEFPIPKFDLTKFMYQLYMGSPKPLIVFDGNHFNIQGLHNPENIGNDNDSSYPLSNVSPDRNGEADAVVYKLNPQEQYLDYTPDRAPMNNNPPQLFATNGSGTREGDQNANFNIRRSTFLGGRYGQYPDPSAGDIPNEPGKKRIGNTPANKYNITTGSADTPQRYQMLNNNLIPWNVYDSKGGIFIEDFGWPESQWDEGIWGILGFTYAQFHSTTNSRLERIDSDNVNSLSAVTTNSEIVATDSKDWVTNPMGDPIYTDNPCFAQTYLLRTDVSGVGNDGSQQARAGRSGPFPHDDSLGSTTQFTMMANYPPLNVKTESMKLIAQRLPLSMVRGYYGVRCDIVPRSQFLGGIDHARLPLLGICPKTTAIGDFFYTGATDMVFTMNKHTRLSNVRIQITDPDGSDAVIDGESTILIKVSRKKKAIYNQAQYIQQLMLEEEEQAKQTQAKK